jgi:hypothetical protein
MADGKHFQVEIGPAIRQTLQLCLRQLPLFMAITILALIGEKTFLWLISGENPLIARFPAGHHLDALHELRHWIGSLPGVALRFLASALIVQHSYDDLREHPASLRDDIFAVRRNLSACLGIAGVNAALDIVPLFPGLLTSSGIDVTSPWVRLLLYSAAALMICFAIVMIVLLLAWAMVLPVALIEDVSFPGVLTRSATLTRGHRVQIFLFWIALGLIFTIPEFAVWLLSGVGIRSAVPVMAWTFAGLVTELANIFGFIALAVGSAAIYVQLRGFASLRD